MFYKPLEFLQVKGSHRKKALLVKHFSSISSENSEANLNIHNNTNRKNETQNRTTKLNEKELTHRTQKTCRKIL